MAKLPKLIMKGDKELIRKLHRLSKKRQISKVLRQATTAAGQELVKAVRAKYPVDTGFSRKSVTKKIIRTRSGYTAIVGVDSAAVATKPNGELHIPHKIDHLIEFGYTTGGTHVPAVAPLRRGYEDGRASAEAKFTGKATLAIEKEATRK